MDRNIEDEIKGCEVCVCAKERRQRPLEKMGQTSTAINERFLVFYMDLMGPMYNGYASDPKYLMTITDACTKFPEAFPLKEPTVENICKILLTEFFPRYGTGMKLVTDRGSQFISKLMRQVCDELGVIKAETQAYQPHTNQVERLNRDIGQAIRTLMVQENIPDNKWHKCLGGALAQIRFLIVPRLGYSPFFLVTGAHPVVPAVQLDSNMQNAPTSVNELVNTVTHADDEEENGKQEDKNENGNMDELDEAYMSEAGAEEIKKEVKNMEESPNKMQGSVEKKNKKRKATPEYKQKLKKLLSATFDELAALLDGKTHPKSFKRKPVSPHSQGKKESCIESSEESELDWSEEEEKTERELEDTINISSTDVPQEKEGEENSFP
nr:uncharacterized protein LOC121127011 [Lepeophtheirus salmonis]